MRMLRLVLALLLCFLFGGLVTLLTSNAYAYCCGCSCMYGCTCPGYWDYQYNMPCYYCRSTDSETLQNSAAREKAVQQLIPVSDLTIGRKCFRDKVALGLLGKNRENLKLKPITFDKENTRNQILALAKAE